MDTTSFLTLSFTLACSLGPLIGGLLAVGTYLLDQADDRGFTLTVGKRPRRVKADKERRHDAW